MDINKAIILLIPLLFCLLAGWYVNWITTPSSLKKNQSPYLELDPGTKYDEKTRMLYSTSWRFGITMPGRPTKIKDMPVVNGIAQAGLYQSPDIIYVAGPPTQSLSCAQDEVNPASIAKRAKFECNGMVGGLRGKESVGHPISLGATGYQGYYSEGFCEKGRYYKAETFIDDENQSSRMVPFYLLVTGKYELVNSKQTDEFFNSFRILPRGSNGKI